MIKLYSPGEKTNRVSKLPAVTINFFIVSLMVSLCLALSLYGFAQERSDEIRKHIEDLKSSDYQIHSRATDALRQIGKEAVPALIAALKDEDADVRRSAATALGKIGAEAKEAIPSLTDALKDEDADVRNNAAEALSKIGAKAKEAK